MCYGKGVAGSDELDSVLLYMQHQTAETSWWT